MNSFRITCETVVKQFISQVAHQVLSFTEPAGAVLELGQARVFLECQRWDSVRQKRPETLMDHGHNASKATGASFN